jgi:hypothetical protein
MVVQVVLQVLLHQVLMERILQHLDLLLKVEVVDILIIPAELVVLVLAEAETQQELVVLELLVKVMLEAQVAMARGMVAEVAVQVL